MAIKTTPYDSANYFATERDQVELLSDALKTGDAGDVAHALGIIARAHGMSKVASKAGVAREALYKSLSSAGDPRLSTILGAAKALGLEISMKPLRTTKRKIRPSTLEAIRQVRSGKGRMPQRLKT